MEQPYENHFPNGISIISTPYIYIYTLITTIFQEKEIFVAFQNGGQITDFHFASFSLKEKKKFSRRNCSMKFGSN